MTRVLGLLYKAFAELGKAIKTIFLSQYLHGEALRREIHEDLNVAKRLRFLCAPSGTRQQSP
jgi:TnpA family transposase